MLTMQPVYFAGPAGPLFGCYHPPRGSDRNTAVLLANAHGHEYIQFHRVFRQLARMLSEAGFSVLRFDYSGCGDSVGGPELWSLERWSADMDSALAELQRLADTEHIGVVGLRLGGTIACRKTPRRSSLRFLILWDPVVSGRAFLQEQRAAHQSMLHYAHVLLTKDAAAGEEVLGFPVPETWAGELDALQLETLLHCPARRVLLIESNSAHSQAALHDALTRLGTVQQQSFANPHLWTWTEDFATVHVPIQILQAIVSEVMGDAS